MTDDFVFTTIFIQYNYTRNSFHSFHQKRIAIPRKSTQKLMLKWCQNKLPQAQLYTLSSQLADFPEIHTAFLWTREVFQLVVPNNILVFFTCLAQPSPVCSYLPPSDENFDLISQSFVREVKSDSVTMLALSRKLPVFYQLLNGLKLEERLPSEFKGVIFKLVELSKEPFKCSVGNHKPEKDSLVSHFPSLPLVRKRGCYALDKSKLESGCTKIYTRHLLEYLQYTAFMVCNKNFSC